jgi:hypothetical protein
MQKIDNILLGDNQFFGINHMSQEKAQQLAEIFFNLPSILEVYQISIDSGIRAIMLNSNDRAAEICDHFIANKSKYPEMTWYPSIPYPHKYANIVSEKGIVPGINEILLKNNSALDILGILTKGGVALIGKDAVKLLQMLIDIEMKIFSGLNIKVIFLQNIVTDLLLGYEVKDIFYEYCHYIRNKYGATPGLITQNMPLLIDKLEEWGIEDVVICTSFNKIGYLMSPNVESYVEAARNNDVGKYQLMAMSTLASGAIPVDEAFRFIHQQSIQSVVFGASSRKHIEETVSLLRRDS